MANPLRLLTVIGARPQIIKAAALSRAIRAHFVGRIEETLLHTGQHYDANMSQVFFDELGIPAADVQLGVGSGPHGAMTARMIEGIERVLERKAHDVVVVYGDTNSTLAGALAASKMHVPVAHVEAGLRSFNKRMPEEVNRVLCDHASTWLFCPTDTAVQNLGNEGISTRPGCADIDRPKVILSGDVMYDNSLYFSELAKERSTVLADLSIGNGEFILVTVHRDHNTDDRTRLNAIYRTLLDVHTETGLAFVVPVHPRTQKMMDELIEPELLRSMRVSPGFHLIDPVGFFDMIALESGCRLVVTDSGGVQKEAYFFNRPCVVLRAETEWVELLGHGQAILADADPQRIRTAVDHFLRSGAPDCPPIFGDGHAAERICHELIETL
jgi:UDP-GlcNAc3NAcA epimerase